MSLNLLEIALTFVIHGFSAIIINRVFIKNTLVRRYSIIPAFIFLLLTSNSIFIEFNNYVVPLLVSLISLIGLSEIYSTDKENERIFNAGLLSTVFIPFYPEGLVFTIPIVVSFQLLYGINNWRKIGITLTAIFIPIFIFLTIQITLFEGVGYLDQLLNQCVDLTPLTEIDYQPLLIFISPLVVTFICFIDLHANFGKKGILPRKFILFAGFYFFICALSILFLVHNLESLIFMILPLVLVISNYFEHAEIKKVTQVLFVLLIILCFGGSFFQLSS